MKPINLTTEILKGICDEGRKTNERIEQTNERIAFRRSPAMGVDA